MDKDTNFILIICFFILFIGFIIRFVAPGLFWYPFFAGVIVTMILINKYLIPSLNAISNSEDKAFRRKAALKTAAIYLAPYKNIWKDLELSNKYCKLQLGSTEKAIFCKEKIYPHRMFMVLSSNVHEYTDLWDMFCINFSHYKTFDGLLKDCKMYEVSVECIDGTPKPTALQESKKIICEKLDINNCSEIEITELPGISIVIAKKIVKKRDEINGFKTVEDFFLFLKPKPHIEKQLREKICVNKMKNTRKKIERNAERKVDL